MCVCGGGGGGYRRWRTAFEYVSPCNTTFSPIRFMMSQGLTGVVIKVFMDIQNFNDQFEHNLQLSQ